MLQTKYFYHVSPFALPTDPTKLRLNIPAASWKSVETPDVPMLCGLLETGWYAHWSRLIDNERGYEEYTSELYKYELPRNIRKKIRRILAAYHLMHKNRINDRGMTYATVIERLQNEYKIQIEVLRSLGYEAKEKANKLSPLHSYTVREIRFMFNPWTE